MVTFSQRVKQAIDSLGGSSGQPTDRAVTFNDLVGLGVVSAKAVVATGGQANTGGGSGGTTVVVNPYVISGFVGSTLGASQVVLGHRFPVKVAFPAGFGSVTADIASQVGAFVAATGATQLSIQQCLAANDPTNGASWSTVGTVSFAAGSAAATIASSGPVTYAEGDFLRIVAPATADATLAQVFLALAGSR